MWRSAILVRRCRQPKCRLRYAKNARLFEWGFGSGVSTRWTANTLASPAMPMSSIRPCSWFIPCIDDHQSPGLRHRRTAYRRRRMRRTMGELDPVTWPGTLERSLRHTRTRQPMCARRSIAVAKEDRDVRATVRKSSLKRRALWFIGRMPKTAKRARIVEGQSIPLPRSTARFLSNWQRLGSRDGCQACRNLGGRSSLR